MQSTLKRLAAVAALGTTGILVPAAGASAAVTPTTPATFADPTAGFRAAGSGWGGHGPFGLGVGTRPVAPLAVPGVHPTVVVGPTIVITTPSTFVNTNNQVSPATT